MISEVVSPDDALRALSATALMGSGLQRAQATLSELAAALATTGDRALALKVQVWSAELELAARRPAATEALFSAATRCDAAGERQEALRMRLLLARGLAATGRLASGAEVIAEIRAEAEEVPALTADLYLARAATGDEDGRRLWQLALPKLSSPARDHDRYDVQLALGILARNGGDLVRARSWWLSALSLAQTWEDAGATLNVSALLGNLLVEVGLPAEAEEHLARAVDLAETLDDPLTLIAEACILCSAYLGRQAWEEADAVALRMERAAIRRNHWLAQSDAAITRAAAANGRGDLDGALSILLSAATRLRELGASVALNVLKARLGELRLVATPAVFDPTLNRVALRLRPK